MIHWLAVPALLAASATAVSFAPPLDQPILQTRVQTRTIGAETLTFTATRRIVFRPAAEGFAADVTLIAAHGEGPTAAAFERGLAGLLGRPVRYWLERDGALRSVDDVDAVWTAWTSGLPAAPAAPRERRLAIIGSPLVEIIGSPPAIGKRPVRVPVAAVGGQGDALPGFETVATAAPNRVRAVTKAQGPMRLPPAAGGAQATTKIERSRLYDTTTGLLIEDSETAETRVGKSRLTTVTRTSLTLPVS